MGEFPELGARLKELRKQLKMHQPRFAKLIGVSTATLSAYETGAKNPSIGVLKAISEKCNVSIDWICGVEHDTRPHTLGDIARFLFVLEDAFSVVMQLSDIAVPCDRSDRNAYFTNDYEGWKRDTVALSFNSSELEKFLDDWKIFSQLFKNGTVDPDIYEQWKISYTRKLDNSSVIYTDEIDEILFDDSEQTDDRRDPEEDKED